MVYCGAATGKYHGKFPAFQAGEGAPLGHIAVTEGRLEQVTVTAEPSYRVTHFRPHPHTFD